MTQEQLPLRKTGSASDLRTKLLQSNARAAKRILGSPLPARVFVHLKSLSREYGLSVQAGELQIIDGKWYVTHTVLLRLARRKRCRGIHVVAVDSLCDSAANRFVLKVTVYPSKDSAGFVGYGDAAPCNVSLLVRGAEMRIAENRAVNRALPRLLRPFWFAFLAWRPQAIGVLPGLRQGALEKELNLLICRAVLPFRESRVWANSSELNYYPGGDIPKLWEESVRIENRVHVRVTSQGCLFRLGLVPSGVGCLSCDLATLFWCRPFPSGLSADLPALAAETGKQCSHAFGQATTFLGLAHEQQFSRARRPHASR